MTLFAIASLVVAFPSDGARLPAVENCYVIGATRPGVTNVVVAGKNVPVYKTGAWSTLVPVEEGTNVIAVAGGGETKDVTVIVPKAKKKSFTGLAALAGTNSIPAAAKKWEKLPYASEKPAPHPFGKAPGETTIVIDPGHGGGDTGALSPHAFPEKDANLRVARETRKALGGVRFHTPQRPRHRPRPDRAQVLGRLCVERHGQGARPRNRGLRREGARKRDPVQGRSFRELRGDEEPGNPELPRGSRFHNSARGRGGGVEHASPPQGRRGHRARNRRVVPQGSEGRQVRGKFGAGPAMTQPPAAFFCRFSFEFMI